MLFPSSISLNQTPLWVVTVTLTIAFLFPTTAFPQSGAISTDGKIAQAITSGGLLDGRQFKAGIVRADAEQDGEKPPLGDELIFSNGKFSSATPGSPTPPSCERSSPGRLLGRRLSTGPRMVRRRVLSLFCWTLAKQGLC